MKDKEKQIEEMAKVLENRIINKNWRAEKLAKELYEIAVPKDSIVLIRKEVESICDKCHWVNDYKILKIHEEEVIKLCEQEVRQASKETAEKILRELKHSEFKFTIEINKSSQEDVSKVLEEVRKSVFGKINDFVKQFGVEIKE